MGVFVQSIEQKAESIISSIDFNKTVMHEMPGFLLFAGALHVNLTDLKEQKWTIAALASFGVALSTVLVALLASGVFALPGLEVRFIWIIDQVNWHFRDKSRRSATNGIDLRNSCGERGTSVP